MLAIGTEAMKRFNTSDILISGLSGLGVEIAKNICLSGVRSVTLHDLHCTTYRDLSAQYYLSEQDLGKNRAEACMQKVRELNGYVRVHSSTENLTNSLLSHFTCVILVDYPLTVQQEIDNYCHKNNIKFIACTTQGLWASVFCDFGPSFEVWDTDGEQPKTAILENITQEINPIISCISSQEHELATGDFIKFINLKGTSLNSNNTYKVKVINTNSFKLENIENKLAFESGEFIQVKYPEIIDFMNLSESLKNTKFGSIMMADFDRQVKLFALYRAYDELIEKIAKIGHCFDTKQIEEMSRQYTSIKIDSDIVDKFCHCIGANLAPIDSFIGGFVAQETLKACSGKFTPLNQWFMWTLSIVSLITFRS